MTSKELLNQAEQIYRDRLRVELERTHPNSFVAIEPISGEYFLGPTLSEASAAANLAYPSRRTCVLRVGESATVHIGGWG